MNKIKLARITQQFLDYVDDLVKTKIYSTPGEGTKKGAGWVSIVKVEHPEQSGNAYYYAERLGKNSLAFILKDEEKEKCAVLKQFSSQENNFKVGCFTGSLEKEDLDVVEHLVEEVKEEAGYDVVIEEVEDRIKYVGMFPLGGITNESVYLYVVDVTGLKQKLKEPENIFELNTDVMWIDKSDLIKLNDWKANIIAYKYLLK